MRESIRKLVQVGATPPRFVGLQPHVLTFLVAPTTQSHKIWNLWEVGKFEGSPNAEARAKAVARVDAMFLERMRKIHIGPPLVYPAVDTAPDIAIDYTATSDPYSTFVTAHFSPQQHERKLVQATTDRESALMEKSQPPWERMSRRATGPISMGAPRRPFTPIHTYSQSSHRENSCNLTIGRAYCHVHLLSGSSYGVGI